MTGHYYKGKAGSFVLFFSFFSYYGGWCFGSLQQVKKCMVMAEASDMLDLGKLF